MINLLQGSEKRQLKLAELLIHNGDWMSIKELADQLNCSERILKYDLQAFRKILSDFTIETSHLGVRLIFDDNKGLKNIYHSIFDSSNVFKVLEIIFFNETYSVNKLADMLYISTSTLYRVIHQINLIIEDDGFYIETNPCRVEGSEDNIRYFYYQFFYEKYTAMSWPYSHINQDIVNDLSYFFMELTDFNADFAYYNIAELILFVNLYRFQREHYIIVDPTKIDLTNIFNKLDLFPKSVNYFEKIFRLKINEEFIIQITSPFIKNPIAFNYEQFLRNTEKNKKINTEVNLLRELLNKLSSENDIPLTNKEDLVFKIYNALYSSDYDPRSGHILYNHNKHFLDVVKNDFHDFLEQLYDGIKKYLKILDLPTAEKNIEFLVYILFTEWKDLILELYQQNEKVKVLIISNRNKAFSSMLKNLLESKFNTELVADVYNDTIVSKSILEQLDYDFVVSNFPLPQLRTKDNIYIENIPTRNDYFQVRKKIDYIIDSK